MQSAKGFEYGVKHIISPQSGLEMRPLLEVLHEVLDLPLVFLQNLLDLGAIYISDQRCLENKLIAGNTYIRVHTKPRRFPTRQVLGPLNILFQNSFFVVVNKPSGLPVHPSVDNIQENLLTYLEQELQQKLFITHRLDVPTSGLIIYAKTKEFQTAFNKILIQREVQKIYRARVQKQPNLGLLTHYMEPSPRAPKKVDRISRLGWQECVLEILKITPQTEVLFELEILLHTGRTHQIRAQLGFENCPIVGDHAYGGEKIFATEKIELQAAQLKFKNPLTDENHHFKLGV